MADDLIPPPSPAGRPAPEGGAQGAAGAEERDLRERPEDELPPDSLLLAVRPDDAGPPQAERDAEAAPDQTPGLHQSAYRSRFGLITGALIGLAFAAVLVLVVAISTSTSADDQARWSEWRPTSQDAYSAANEIARHVGAEYRLNNGGQLVLVESGPIAVNDVPLNVVVRTAAVGGDIIPIQGDGVWYILNGLGARGSIEGETPSTKRLALLKREALELALYTFRYTDLDHVVALLPSPPPSATATSSTSASGNGAAAATATPTPAATTTVSPTPTSTVSGDEAAPPATAMLFRPGDLASELRLPLALTLAPKTPRPQTLTDRDEVLLNQRTVAHTFNASVRTTQTGATFLVLDRPSTTTGAATATATPTATPTPAATKKPAKKRRK